MSPTQQKLAIRLVVGLFAIAILFAGWNWFTDFLKDPDTVRFESVDHVAAIRTVGSVSQVVVLKPNGEEILSPVPDGFDPAKPEDKPFNDQSVSWAPNGFQVFFSSNRSSPSFNIYRWNPARKDVEQRSTGSRSQTTPLFGPQNLADPSRSGMILSGGFVFRYDPKETVTEQVLPPVMKNRLASGEEGATGPLDQLYRDIGSSFKDAQWGADQTSVFAVMRRDLGEIFIMNPLGRDSQGMFLRPRPVIAGRTIQMAVTPDGTTAVVSLRGFQYISPDQIPEDMRNRDGTARNPWEHGLIRVILKPTSEKDRPLDVQVEPIALWRPAQEEEQEVPETVFLDPAISPDGTAIAVVVARVLGPNQLQPQGIALVPNVSGGGTQTRFLLSGEVSSPSWSADGKSLSFIRRVNGRGHVFIVNLSNGTERQLTRGEADYSRPVMSPQLPAASQ
ncbi:MAG: hypothetical protein MUC92_01290 [Fimbriimonadaceae bacterium]|jgi:hypothetical protein|nr:hypothetical protein [Fimbriimonadaceae bacterium]